MARPTKQGLEYFPMDVDADTDEKVEYLTAKCGFMAFGVYVHLLMKIYKNGYFLEWSDRTLYVTAKRLSIPADDLKKIIDGGIEAELFDAEIFNKFSVLTSQSIQKRYLAATEKRKGANIGQYSLLIVNSEITSVNSEKTIVNSEITTVNSELSTQSKVKESKVNNNNNSNELLLSAEADAGVSVKTVVEHYHARCPSLQKVKELTPSRRQTINARMRELKTISALDSFLDTVENSDFITGRDGRWQGKRGIDWIFKQQNFVKILEGNYNNKDSPPPTLSPEEIARKQEENTRRYEAAMQAQRAKVAARYGGALNGNESSQRSAS